MGCATASLILDKYGHFTKCMKQDGAPRLRALIK